MITSQQQLAIKRCRSSVAWFLRNFGKIKHQSAGIIPFTPFDYQLKAIKAFRKHRFNIFRKTRQAGISKIAGSFALWYAMFFANKTILIVSRKDDDAMSFLREHIVFLYNNLPEWMRTLWKPVKLNEHEILFPNGSSIKSLTSHPDVLRSNSSALNIIDEAAFIQGMDAMWAAGYPTLMHGGSVIIVSTCSGIGGWYWSTMTDAEAGVGMFNPIVVNWWDMDWIIEYQDPLSREKKRIAPRDDIRKTVTKEEIAKYGSYWSPWLEEQWLGLQARGETWKFDQEILANFVGSGNTVLDKETIAHVGTTVCDPELIVEGVQDYVHPVSGLVEPMDFDFGSPEEGLWVWEKPIAAQPEKRVGSRIVQHASQAHAYSMGVDIATGKGRDYSTIEVFDLDEREQAAEFMVHCLPRELVKYIDRIGRWYNCALAVVERNNGGDIVIDSLRYDVCYPRIWRRKEINDKPQVSKRRRQRAMRVLHYGFSTSSSSKQSLNKILIDYIRADDNNYRIYSRRLLKQLLTYVRKRDRLGRDTLKTEAEEGAGNFDDLVIATALALIGVADAAFMIDASNLMPASTAALADPTKISTKRVEEFIAKGGTSLLMPAMAAVDEYPDLAARTLIDNFTVQLGGVPMVGRKPAVIVPRKYFER